MDRGIQGGHFQNDIDNATIRVVKREEEKERSSGRRYLDLRLSYMQNGVAVCHHLYLLFA